MSSTGYWSWEQEITRLTTAIRTRNALILKDLIAGLGKQFTLAEVSGLTLISLQRLTEFDPDAILWAIEFAIPGEVMKSIHEMTSVALYQSLIYKGFQPGIDISVNAKGQLLLRKG